MVKNKLAKGVRNESYFLCHRFLNSCASSIFLAKVQKLVYNCLGFYLNKTNKPTNLV